MDFERVGPEDWERFRSVRLASLRESPAAFGARYDDWRDAPEGRWRRRLTDVPLTVVARQGTDDVGVVSGQHDGPGWAQLISMWVHPSVRGAGVAALLIEEVVAWAAAEGRSTSLMVRSDNARARAAYERVGFVDVGVPAGWPEEAPPERRMERRY